MSASVGAPAHHGASSHAAVHTLLASLSLLLSSGEGLGLSLCFDGRADAFSQRLVAWPRRGVQVVRVIHTLLWQAPMARHGLFSLSFI